MKYEIEITDDEIKAALERKIRVAIADQTNQWGTDQALTAMVKAHWKDAMERVVTEELAKVPALRLKVAQAIEAKLRGQLNAAMKVAK
jgi:hypothetical protein